MPSKEPIPTQESPEELVRLMRQQADDIWHIAGHQDCARTLADYADRVEALLLQRAQETRTLTKELSTEREKHDEEAYNDAMAEIDVLKAKLTAQAQAIAQVQAELREAYLRQGCACSCCDHGEGSDCACECHATGKCAAEAARVSRAPQVEPPCDKVCQDCGSIFTIGELEREDRAVWGHPCRDSKGWSNPIDKPSSGRERRCESFRAPVQPAPQPEHEQVCCRKCHKPFDTESIVRCAWCGWTQPLEKGESS